MCVRYYLEEDWEEKVREDTGASTSDYSIKEISGDIHPTDMAPVISASGDKLDISAMRWGFPRQGGIIFNARAEGIWSMPVFKGIESRRTVVPAASFYEWNSEKDKFTFTRKDNKRLYLAGFYDLFEQEERFVIITTKANHSMHPVHDRMPLIINSDMIHDWIFENDRINELLHTEPAALDRRIEYEQLTFF